MYTNTSVKPVTSDGSRGFCRLPSNISTSCYATWPRTCKIGNRLFAHSVSNLAGFRLVINLCPLCRHGRKLEAVKKNGIYWTMATSSKERVSDLDQSPGQPCVTRLIVSSEISQVQITLCKPRTVQNIDSAGTVHSGIIAGSPSAGRMCR